MNLEYSDEQMMLRDQVTKFCESDYTFDKREKIISSDEVFNKDIWKQFSDLGWLSIPFNEDNGGFNFGPIELSIIFEEFGKNLVVEPYLANVVMSGKLLEIINSDQSKSLITKIISGDKQISLAISEPDNAYNFHSIKTNVSESNSKILLNGNKSIVLNSKNADYFIVYAVNQDKENGLYLVNSDTAGLSINNFKTFDGQICGELTFENVEVDKSNVLVSGDSSVDAINSVMDYINLCLSAEAVGAMIASYTKTVQYTKEREQFDQPISNFQVLQHKMVDMFIEAEISKSLLFKAMLQLDSNDNDASKTISSLKAQIGKSGRFVGQTAVQLHGGMGVSDEMSIGHYLKRLTAIDALFGNRNYHLNRFASL